MQRRRHDFGRQRKLTLTTSVSTYSKDVDIEDELRSYLVASAAALDIPERQLTLIPHSPARSRRHVMTAAAALAILLAGYGLTNGTADLPVGLPDLPAPQVADLGASPLPRSFAWQRQTQINADTLVTSGDQLWAFSRNDGLGLEAWSYDGAIWTSHGQVIDDTYEVGEIYADDLGFVTMGHREDLQFSNDSGGTLLTSATGTTWEEYVIPMVSNGPLHRADLIVAGGGRALISVSSGVPEHEWEALAINDFETAFTLEVRRTGTSIDIVSEEFDLILDSFDISDSAFPTDPSETISWYWSDDYATWHQLARVFPDWVPQSNGSIGPDGEYLIRTTLPDGTPALAVSPDLREWGSLPDPIQGFGDIVAWNDSYLAATDGRFRPRIFQSYDLTQWAPLTAYDPETNAQDYVHLLAASDRGIALVYANPVDKPAFEPIVVNTETGSVTIDPKDGLILASTGPNWSVGFTDGIGNMARYDPDTDQIGIFLPGDEAPRLVVSAAAIVEAYNTPRPVPSFDASLLITTDGINWRFVDISDQTSVELVPTDLVFLNDQLAIAFRDPDGNHQVYLTDLSPR